MVDRKQILDVIHNAFGNRKIVVIGDLMLDRYVIGDIQRISPEAPVPILRQTSQIETPGGAANVALNLARLGLQVQLLGAIGVDQAGKVLERILRSEAIDVQGMARKAGRPTTTKTRLTCGRHQLARVDLEVTSDLDDTIGQQILEDALQAIRGASAVVLSDYAKGVVSPQLTAPIIAGARKSGTPIIVDPKGPAWSKYAGATLVTPNRTELAQATGQPVEDLEALLKSAASLRDDLDIDCLAVTLGDRGIEAFDRSGRRPFPSESREVFDVSGAGDTVVATITAGLVSGLAIDDALWLANVAAGVVVGRAGTVPIDRDALAAAVRRHDAGHLREKICCLEELTQRIDSWRARQERIVFTNGCFDLVHAGHVLHLADARQLGDRLIVGLNSDKSVRGLKGPTRPIQGEKERAILLAGLSSVDAVVLFDDPTPRNLVVALRPDVLVKGSDYQNREIAGAADLALWGGKVVNLPLVEGHSTTNIISRIQSTGP